MPSKKMPFLRIQYIKINENAARSFMDYDFFYILDGTIRVRQGGKVFLFSKGDVFLFVPGVEYSIATGGNNLVLSIILDKSFVELYHQSKTGYYVMNSAYDGTRDYEPIRQYMLQIADANSNSTNHNELRLSSLAFSLLYYMEEYHFEEKLTSDADSTLSTNDRIQSILQYVQANYSSAITLQDIAGTMSISVPYLSTFFKKNVGTSFNTYLNQIRLEHAVEELSYSDKSITEITYDNGFPSMNAFHKLFKEKYNTTPSRYRAEMSEKRDSSSNSAASSVEEINIEDYYPHLAPLTHNTANRLNDIALPIQESYHVKDMSYSENVVPIWRSMINVGEISSFDYRFIERQLGIMQEKVEFSFARFENVAQIHNSSILTQLDTCIDTLEAFNLRPYFCFNIPFEDCETRGNELIIDIDEYLNFLEKIITHCANVHGIDYLATWYFELSPHYDITNFKFENQEHFAERFVKAYELIKSYIPKAQVGGFSHNFFYSVEKTRKSIELVKSNGIIPDFFSCGGFPYESSNMFDNSLYKDYIIYTEDKDFYLHKVQEFKQVIYDIYNTYLPVHLTCMGPDLVSNLYMNDTCFQSSFLFHNIVSLINEVDVLGFFKLSDIDVSNLNQNSYLNGSPGLMNRYGLEKPGAHLLSIFAKCRTNMVARGEDFIILKGNVDRYMIGLCNHTYISDIYRHNINSDITITEAYNIFEQPRTKNISLELNNLTPGTYDLIQFQIYKDHGSILNEWERNNYWDGFNKDELDHLKGINKPKRTHFSKEAPDGTLKFQFQLAPHEVMFISLFLRF